MACRRKRITFEQAIEYVTNVRKLQISSDNSDPARILSLPALARRYDAAYLGLAIRRNIALATTDEALRRAASKAGVPLAKLGPKLT